MRKKDYPVDKYPEKDCYIPQAEQMANRRFKNRRGNEWSRGFLLAMDGLLAKEGLRQISENRKKEFERVYG